MNATTAPMTTCDTCPARTEAFYNEDLDGVFCTKCVAKFAAEDEAAAPEKGKGWGPDGTRVRVYDSRENGRNFKIADWPSTRLVTMGKGVGFYWVTDFGTRHGYVQDRDTQRFAKRADALRHFMATAAKYGEPVA